jgi:hypothetical protein
MDEQERGAWAWGPQPDEQRPGPRPLAWAAAGRGHVLGEGAAGGEEAGPAAQGAGVRTSAAVGPEEDRQAEGLAR